MSWLPPCDILARLPLLPVLVGQAIWVRSRTLKLPEAAGPRSGEGGQGPSLRVLILGDSSAAGVGAKYQSDALAGQVVKGLSAEFSVHWTLVAASGATTKDAHAMLGACGVHDADVVLVALGVNDAIRLTPIKRWMNDQRALRTTLRRNNKGARLVFTAVPPLQHFPALPKVLRWVLGAHAARMDAALKAELRDEADAFHLKIEAPFTQGAMAADGYHPSENTYAIWGQSAAETLREVYARKPE